MGCLHASILCAAMGFVAGLLGVVVVVATSLVPFGGGFGQVMLLGLVYGFVVVYPLSRWVNRTVFWSIIGIAVCVLCYGALVPNAHFLRVYLRPWLVRGAPSYLRFLYSLMVFAPPLMVLGVFMQGHHRRPLGMLLAVFLSVVVFAFAMELQNVTRIYWPAIFTRNVIVSMTIGAQPVLLSWTFLAVALGMRLWPSMREPEPPAS